MMARYRKPSMREQSMRVFINSTFPNLLGDQYPDIAYDLLIYMLGHGLNNTNIGKVFGRGPGAVGGWRVAISEEQASND